MGWGGGGVGSEGRGRERRDNDEARNLTEGGCSDLEIEVPRGGWREGWWREGDGGGGGGRGCWKEDEPAAV